LQEAVLGQEDNLLQAVEEVVKHWQNATRLDLNLASLLIIRSWVVKERSVLTEENEGVEKARLDLMGQVCRLDLQVGEDS